MPVQKKVRMTCEEKRKLLDSAKGRWFSAEFVKKSGELRKMTCKKWERKFLHGESGENVNTVAHLPQYYTVAEEAVQGYRNISLDTLKRVRLNGVEYIFED